MSTPLPLDDIRVIEIDSWMAAPSAAAILSDLGADVIKIEPLSGDPMRNTTRPAKVNGAFKGYDFQFDVDNRGKRSIAVDLASDEGRNIVHRLCEGADVFLCNLLQHRQEKFGLSPEQLWKTNSKLVHATLTGYGTDGPEAWRPGYDVTAFFGRSGLYDSMRDGDDGQVAMAQPAQGDHTTGLALLSGILAALRLAERTGTGQAIETSLFETAVWTLATDYGITAVDQAPVRRRSRRQQIVATANRYPCGDDNWVVFNMPEEAAWPRFCTALGLEGLLDDDRLQDMKGRFDNMAEIVDLVDAALGARPRDEWGPIFDEHRLIWGPVLGLHEVVADPQAEAIALFPTIEHAEHGEYRTVRAPIRIQGVDTSPRRSSPTPGQHTRSVLADAGFDDAAIDQLIADGKVAQPEI
jgi:crotonobetainyl-CoA:carnitine CoA-transferase CaiB-like acyl-CoA transferase